MDFIVSLFGDLFYAFVVLAFIAAVLLIEGLYLTWNAYKGPEAKRLERRMRALSAGGSEEGEASIIKRRLLAESTPLQQMVLSLPRIRELDRLLQQAGSSWSVGTFVLL